MQTWPIAFSCPQSRRDQRCGISQCIFLTLLSGQLHYAAFCSQSFWSCRSLQWLYGEGRQGERCAGLDFLSFPAVKARMSFWWHTNNKNIDNYKILSYIYIYTNPAGFSYLRQRVLWVLVIKYLSKRVPVLSRPSSSSPHRACQSRFPEINFLQAAVTLQPARVSAHCA